MVTPTYYLLHVADPETSGGFYRELFGVAPVESSPTFVLFVLDGGIKSACGPRTRCSLQQEVRQVPLRSASP